MSEFIIGQRWASASEPELGLGIVLAVEVGRVTILFLACNERRVYAQDNSPLTRVRFLPDDKIEIQTGEYLIVKQVTEEQGILSYHADNEDGGRVVVDEMDLSHHSQFNKPQDKLFIGQAEAGRWFSLRFQTWSYLHQLHKSEAKGLLGARASLIPHQLYIAHEVARRERVRIMLADEVGLGKTIEAGLILHHRLQMGLSSRIMVIVPESLLHQWLVEMLRRFNLRFSLFDESRCLAIDAESPFLSEQLVLCSQGFFEANPERKMQALQASWDIVVVDEAHHLQWDETQPSPEYLFIEQLAEVTEGLILLTATPEQLGKQTHFAQLRLLDASRFHSYELFKQEEKEFEPIARLAENVINECNLNDSEQDKLASLIDGKLCANFLSNGGSEELKQEVIEQLIDRHGTGRVLFRNSRHVVGGFPDRKFHKYPLQAESEDSEKVYLDWLVEKIKQLDGEKILLICKQAETALNLQKSLRDKYAINAAAFHEGMSIVERDRAAAYFADEDAQVRILLCSEIGSEGRNFQFVHHLVLFDLPENPDLLQQRIGRLDRIGQTQIIKIHVPYIVGSKQHSLCLWYSEGMALFQKNNNAASEVYRVKKDELELVCNHDEQYGLAELISSGNLLIKEVEAEMQQSRDLLLELNSCRKDVAERLIEEVQELSQSDALWDYMEGVFEYFGVDSEYHSKSCAILHPGQAQRVTHFPFVTEDGVTVTVSRDVALAREDMQYLTWEHPMVSTSMDLVLSDGVGSAAVSVVKHSKLKAGQYLVECLFLVECSAPLGLQLSRFLPVTPIRILLTQNLENLSEKVLHEELDELVNQFDAEQVTAFMTSEHKNINAMILKAEGDAEIEMQAVVAQASAQMLKISTQEIKRMKALAQVNLSIKDEEVETLKDRAIDSHGYINDAKLRLDAVRFIIAS